MTTQTTSVLDPATAQTPAAGSHRCLSDVTTRDDLFAPDALDDLLPPLRP